ncbi:TPA: hypothetical protein RUZ22_003428, partial [Vibrio cholerae]|nr:hypothetical protein [Vibrio cholerae]
MSNANFVIKYIETRWHDKATLLEVTESQYPLSLDEVSYDSFEASTTIYPNVEDLYHSQIAITYSDRRCSAPPAIILSDGSTMPLKKIVHPENGKVWWVEPGEWNPKSKEWRNNTHRTAGVINFRIEKQTLELHITLSDASKDQLDKYLVDFKSDMWELILDESSYVQGDTKRSIVGSVDETLLKLVDSLLSAARYVLKKPKSELREIQTLKPRKAVKPVPRTFMEIATKGNTRVLTSRGSKPNFNVSENSYVLYALMATQRIVSQLCRVSQSKIDRLNNNLHKLEQRIDSLKDYHKVNRDLVVKDYQAALERVNVDKLNSDITQQLERIESLNTTALCSTGFLKLKGMTKQKDGYFCEIKYGINEPWQKLSAKSLILNLDDTYLSLFKPHTEYRLTAHMSTNWFKNNTLVVFRPQFIHSIEILPSSDSIVRARNKVEEMKLQAIALKNNGWKKQLSNEELKEQDKERLSIKNRKEFFNHQLQNVSHVREFLIPKEKQLRELVKQLSSLGVKPKSSFPNSMTFV